MGFAAGAGRDFGVLGGVAALGMVLTEGMRASEVRTVGLAMLFHL